MADAAKSAGEYNTRQPEKKKNNLPVQLTRFIRREREIMEVKRLLATSRLVMLTGAGGCGKTRLAIELCWRRA